MDDEWNYFLDHKKKMVPVLHQPCKIPYRPSKRQCVDFHTVDFDKAVARLVATLIRHNIPRLRSSDGSGAAALCGKHPMAADVPTC